MENRTDSISPRSAGRILLLILAAAAILRFGNIAFGFPQKFRPDEEYLVSRALGFHTGDLNPGFFIYPTLHMYFLSAVYLVFRGAAFILGWRWPHGGFVSEMELGSDVPLYFIGRVVSAVLAVIGIAVWYRFAASRWGRAAALLSAALLSVNFIHIRESHFGTTDIALTLMITFSLWAMVKLPERPTFGWYVLAGTLAGAAISIKYTAVVLAGPLFAAHAIRLLRSRERPWAARPTFQLAAAGASVLAAFLAGSPYVVLDYQKFLDDWRYQLPFIREGSGFEMDHGWRWLLWSFRYGPGLPVAVAALVGVVIALRDEARDRGKGTSGASAAILAVFAASYCAPLLTSKWLYIRYVLPLMPFMSLFAALAVLRIASRFRNRAVCAVFAAVLSIFVAYDGALRGVQLVRLLGFEDTRTSARTWIDRNIPRGSGIGVHANFYYGKPQLSGRHRYVEWKKWRNPAVPKAGKTVEWVIIDDSPIRYFSPPPPAALGKFLSERSHVSVAFDPFLPPGGDYSSELVYDPQDAFYAPLAGFSAVARPGPRIFIYRIETESGPP